MNKCLLYLFAILSGILLVQFMQVVKAEKIIIQRPAAPTYINSDGTTYVPNAVNYPKVNDLETLIFNNNYGDQPLELRLARLESSVFGAVQSGNYNDRLNRLISASSILTGTPSGYTYYGGQNSTNSYSDQTSGTNVSTKNTSKGKNGLSNLANLLMGGGKMTGYTPPVYQDPYYAQPYYGYSQTCPPYNGRNPSYNPNYNTQQQFGTLPYIPSYANSTNGRMTDIFSNGSGNEFYYTDGTGRFMRDMRSTGGGVGVSIIND